MSVQHLERASPPDDGGHMGSYTAPEHLLFTAPEDTRSSETIGTEPFVVSDASASLLRFWATVIALELLLVAAALWS